MRYELRAIAACWALAVGGCADDAGKPLTLPERDTSQSEVVAGDVCTPNKPYCASMYVSAQCNATGDGPRATTPCEAGTACAPGSGSCVTQACTPNQTACAGGASVARCRPDGLDFLPAEACGEGTFCVEGRCVLGSCLGHVMVLLDRSGSMARKSPTGPEASLWHEVGTALVGLIEANPAARFGLTAFPSGSEGCHTTSRPEIGLTTYHAAERFARWFYDNRPYGNTPLLAAMRTMRDHAAEIFGPDGGTLLVVSDGEDTCAQVELIDQPNPRISTIAAELEQVTEALYVHHGVKTWVIGYNYAGETAELDAIARAGGTGRTTHLPASDAAELSQALGAVVTDWKLCF